MKILHGFLFFFTVVSLVTGAEAQEQAEGPATLFIRIVSLTGSSLPPGKLSVRTSNGTIAYEAEVKGGARMRLPPGDYVVAFESRFLKTVQRAIKMDMKDTFVVLATDMDDVVLDVPNPPVSITIAVRPPAPCTPSDYMWLRLVATFSGYSTERKITASGFALFEPVDVGSYVAIVIDGKEVRAVQPLVTKGPLTSVDIPLPPCKK